MKTKSVSAKLSIRESDTILFFSVVENEKVRKVCQASAWAGEHGPFFLVCVCLLVRLMGRIT